jgi:EAL domain-containing protein (putative c-di-GMP-specific phosphodiesterase class I)
VRDADTAMYLAKAEGRNRSAMFDRALRENLLDDLELEADLRHAVDRGELLLLYQPSLDLTTGWIGAVEALLRWEHPRRGTLRPAAFMRVAEESGAIIPIGHWMIVEACRQFAAWRRAGCSEKIRLDVNLSPRQLADPKLVPIIAGAIAEAGIEPGDLCLEITEVSLLADLERGAEVLTAIRDLGVRLTLDDFGTGHSSLGHLRKMSLDALKVDQSFVQDLHRTRDAEPLIRAIVALGHALDLEVVAEGVETPEQLRAVRELGCDAAQGYILARPATGDRVGTVLGCPSGAVTLFEHLAAA